MLKLCIPFMQEVRSVRLSTLEGELLEYKRMVDGHSLSKEIVAFANTRGGKIKIGVDDNGDVVGVSRKMADSVSNMVRDSCDPPLAPTIDREDYGGQEVITVTVNPGRDVPYMTRDGKYCIRVGATVKTASLSELIDLIVKGPHRGTILLKARMPQLRTQISASMRAGAGFDQALTGIAELSEMAMNTVDESTRMEVVDIAGELLEISCSNDKMILNTLLVLVSLTSIELAQNPHSRPPSRELIKRVIEILEQVLLHVTLYPKVTDRTAHVLAALHMVGLGCAWAGYVDQLRKVLVVINSHSGRDRKLTNLCNDTAIGLAKCAGEKHSSPPGRCGMLLEPFKKRRDFGAVLQLLDNKRSLLQSDSE